MVMRYIFFILSICLLVVSAQAGTFRDDFEDGNLDGWGEILNYGGGTSEWKVDNGVLTCRRPFDGSSLLFFGKKEWKNYSVELDSKMVQALSAFRSIGLDLRVQDEFNTVWCAIGGWNGANNVFIQVWFNNNPLNQPNKGFNLELNQWYHLKGIAKDNNFEFYVDGELQVSFSDSHFLTGRIDLDTNGCLAYFDNVVITGDDVPDSLSAVVSQDKLTTSWGQMKSR
jgi:hypothetical protein